MKNRLLPVLIILFICHDSICQDIESVKRNLIKGSLASSGLFNGMVSIDYERNLVFGDRFKLNIEGTFGKYYQMYNHEQFQEYLSFNSVTTSVNALAGRKNHFLEFSAGARYSIIKEDYYDDISSVFPVINVGYRFQNYFKKGVVFRAFIGTTGLGLSFGIAF